MTTSALFANGTTRQLVPFPKQIGTMDIELDIHRRIPAIDKDRIYIPVTANAVHVLRNNSQLLVKIGPIHPGKSAAYDYRMGPIRFYLTGFDDAPFVAPVSHNQFKAFEKGGEQAFYESLKPASIKLIESKSENSVLRQGDIWAIKISNDWTSIIKGSACFPIETRGMDARIAKDMPLFGSRHALCGEIMHFVYITYSSKQKRGRKITRSMAATLGTGIIEAPDHPNLDISDGIYVIARTNRPENFLAGLD